MRNLVRKTLFFYKIVVPLHRIFWELAEKYNIQDKKKQ